MRSARLLVIFIALFSLSSSKLSSQINTNLFADVFSLDSLKGFDEDLAKQTALNEGLYGQNYSNALRLYKREFVMNKYNLHANYIPQGNASQSWLGSKYSSASVAVAPCTNEGFETGTLAGWTASTGINFNSQAYPSTPTQISAGGQCSVVTLPLTDPFVGTIPVSPFTGSKAVRINDQLTGAVVVKLSQTFPVTTSNYVFEFAYWAVMEDAPSHDCLSTPYMQVRFLNNTGNLQTCPSFSIIAPGSSGGCAGIGPVTWVTVNSGGSTVRTSTGWQKFSVDLGSYITGPISNITAEIIVGDCSQTGHFGYAYFDSNCNTMNLAVNSSTVSMPSPTVFPQVQCGSTATLGAPNGFSPFVWKGPAGSGINSNTSQTITTSIPGNYTLEMSPVGICNPPLTKIINLQFVPPTTVTASPANLCATGTNTSSTLSASGATNYTWMPGGSNSSSITVSPTSTTIYTLTAQTGTCLGTYTLEVTVNPDPVFSVVASNFSVCPGQSATLTAIGATSYSWEPGSLTGAVAVVSPTTTTTYTTVGSSTAGCTSTVSTTINVSAPIVISIVALTPTYGCAGTAVSFAAGNATSFTWQPSNVNGFIQTFNPTVTTTYTVLGSAGACTGSTTVTASINPGPPITTSANPTLTCPGNTTTLSALSPLAVGVFTWSPGNSNASSIVVTPSITGGYSVSAADAMGCKNTQTINPSFSAIVNVAISPSSPSVCSGNSAILTASGAINYTWNPGGITGASAVLTPTSTQIYTVTGQNGAGCVNQETVTVTVVNNPTILASVNPTAICAGKCATITPSAGNNYTITGGSMVVCPATNSVYTLIGDNAAGCISAPITVSVVVNSNPVITTTASPAVICAGNSSTLTAGGALSYVWSTGATGSVITVSPPATQNFTVTGTNTSGCTTETVVTVVVNPLPAVAVTPPAATICPGGSVPASATGATSYSWNPGALTGANVILTPTITTTYTITGANGPCTSQTLMLVTVAPVPVITASFVPGTICAGSCATLNATGSVTNFIVSGLPSPVACPTITTAYSVVGISADGCISNTVTGTLFVNSGPALIASANAATICAGDNSTLTATGALTYTWSNGTIGATSIVTPPVTETFTVIGTNVSGCTSQTVVTVFVTPIPAISVSPSSATICPGGSTSALASGATSYTWNPGGLTGASQTLSPAVTTLYTITGSNGACSSQTVMMVTVAPIPVITATYVPGTICAGSCATLNPSGAVSYIVTGLSSVACPLSTSNYTVVGVDANGCSSNPVTGTLFVNSGPTLIATASPTTICAGDVSVLSGSGANTYTWSTGDLGAVTSVTPASTQTYTLTGTDALGCSNSTLVTVNVNSLPNLIISPSSTTICEGNTLTLSASGATSYTWMPGSSSGTSISVSPTITTTYTVIGANGTCSVQNTVIVTVNPKPTISAAFSPTTICPGSCATLVATGALSYNITGLSAIACPVITSGYTVTGTDALGCMSDPVTGTLPVLPAPAVLASATPNSICPGDSSFVSATGALTYTWQPDNVVAAGYFAQPLITTTYTVTGTNAQNCTGAQTVQVLVTPAPSIIASALPSTICSGSSSTLTANGATNYSWSPGAFTGGTIFVSPTATTVYTVTGNSGACNGSATVMVTVDQTPTVNISATSNTICAGASVTITLNGASTYSWSDGSTSSVRIVNPLTTTIYNITGFGVSGCTSQVASLTISVTPAPAITASANPASICSGSGATLTASGSSGYNWMPGSLSGPVVGVTPSITTIYTVSATSNGCTGTATVMVNVTPGINLTAVSSPTFPICPNNAVNLVGSGATTYTWLPGPLPAASSITVFPAATTIYTLLGSTGPCSAQTTIAVNVVPAVTVNVSASSLSICAGDCSTLTASGALSYTWSNGITGAVNIVCPTSTTTYTVLSSTGSCMSSTTITVFVNSAPTVSITSNANPICTGSSANLTASGATTYSWNTGSTLPSISVSPATNSVYTVTGFNGSCSGTFNYSLTVIPASSINIIATSPSICAGFTIGLLATSASPLNYTWSPSGATGNTFTDTPLTTTIYTVTANNGGCISNATVSILVIPLPIITLTANPASLCAGDVTTLTASGAATYSWIPSLQGGNTFTDAPGTTTTYTVVGFSSLGCPNYTTQVVSVVPAPSITITSSSPSACAGGSATLTANGATNYTWSVGAQSGSMLVVSPSAPTTYTVLGDNGGCVSSAIFSIGINPLPTIAPTASSPSICPGSTVGLSATGGVNYTWTPTGLTGASIVDAPAASTNYTVLGEDANGCTNIGTVFVFVNPMAGITAVASPSDICEGGTVTLTGGGGLSYTWNPGGSTTNPITVTPVISTIYTLMATDASGCTGSFTVPVNVFPNPTITVSPLNVSICVGSSATLTATGAMNYTWLPSGTMSSITVESPTILTTYTVLADNAGLCFTSYTFDIFVNPLPQHVGAASVGTISCSSQTVALFGTCTDTNVSYSWAGPQGYTSTQQNPTVTAVWGTFTLSVTDNVTGCVATETVDVPTDNSIPLVTATTSGSITCAVSTVTLDAVNTTTNPSYSWTGPGPITFTSSIQNPTVTVAGTYTVIVTDLSSTCSDTALVTVGVHTTVAISASITPATCNGGTSNNDGSISVSGFTLTDKYDIVSGTTYTGTATYITAATIPSNGTITSNLANPSTTVAYTLRLFDGEGCTKDTTLYLVPVDCSLKTLGIAKSVSSPTLNSDGSYNVVYKVVVKNYDLGTLQNIQLTENLTNTFPGTTTFTVVSTPTVDPPTSGLTVNSSFDGSLQTNLLGTATNTLASGFADTISFTVKVNTSLFFTGFKNSIIGMASNAANVTIMDSSNVGLNPDPDGDLNPYNNNIPTTIMFTPNTFFGITKVGEIHKSDDESYDITYTVTVHNLGNDTLRDVTLNDELFAKTIQSPATYSMRFNPVSTGGGLVANSSFDGKTNTNLVIASDSKMSPKTTSSVYFTINVIPGTIMSISNSAYGSALTATSPTDNITVSDTSNTGTNPDVNQNGIWNEASDNIPTVLLVPNTHTLFIPEGFSPDGDNNNDHFVIQGLSDKGSNPITIFNRWGNKVYYNANYDNSWDGLPNVSGTLGKDKLPPGTYFYILEMKGSGIKPITGFVVLQY